MKENFLNKATISSEVKTMTIMLVDDNTSLLNTISIMLKRSGFDCICAEDIDTAIELYTNSCNEGRKIDLVVTDLKIGECGTADELLAELRIVNPLVKCVLTSGTDKQTIKDICKKYGFTDMIPKPFRYNDLVNMVYHVV